MSEELTGKRELLGNKIWQAHLNAWRKSGLTGADYCRQRNLSYHAFNYWKKKNSQSVSDRINFVPVPVRVGVNDEELLRSANSPLKVEIGSRFKIEVPDDFSPATLSRLVSSLERLQ